MGTNAGRAGQNAHNNYTIAHTQPASLSAKSGACLPGAALADVALPFLSLPLFLPSHPTQPPATMDPSDTTSEASGTRHSPPTCKHGGSCRHSRASLPDTPVRWRRRPAWQLSKATLTCTKWQGLHPTVKSPWRSVLA